MAQPFRIFSVVVLVGLFLLGVYLLRPRGRTEAVSENRQEVTMSRIDEATRKRIDLWIRKKGLNPYGDPADTVYAGGTPLFNERTGKTKDRYEYILEKHPDLRSENPKK